MQLLWRTTSNYVWTKKMRPTFLTRQNDKYFSHISLMSGTSAISHGRKVLFFWPGGDFWRERRRIVNVAARHARGKRGGDWWYSTHSFDSSNNRFSRANSVRPRTEWQRVRSRTRVDARDAFRAR